MRKIMMRKIIMIMRMLYLGVTKIFDSVRIPKSCAPLFGNCMVDCTLANIFVCFVSTYCICILEANSHEDISALIWCGYVFMGIDLT